MSTRRTSPSNRKPPPCAPAWVWLFAGILIGFFLSFLFYLREIVPHPSTVVVSRDVPVFENEAIAPIEDSESVELSEAESIESAPQTNFEFYEVLPKIEVEVPDDIVSAEVSEANQPTNKPSNYYILQVGAYRDANMAQGLKAHLASLGVQAVIQVAEVNQMQVHRVQIGPSANVNYLNDLRAQLAASQIESIIKPMP